MTFMILDLFHSSDNSIEGKVLHFIYANLKVGSLPTSSCICIACEKCPIQEIIIECGLFEICSLNHTIFQLASKFRRKAGLHSKSEPGWCCQVWVCG